MDTNFTFQFQFETLVSRKLAKWLASTAVVHKVVSAAPQDGGGKI